MIKSKTYKKILTEYPESIVVALVCKRDKRGFAKSYMVLYAGKKKKEAVKTYDKYKALEMEVVMISTYPNNKEVSFMKIKDGVVETEPLISASETARFLRTYYGLESGDGV